MKGMINAKKKEVELARNGGIQLSEPYIQGVQHELIGLQEAYYVIHDIKNNDFTTSDEAIKKRYKS